MPVKEKLTESGERFKSFWTTLQPWQRGSLVAAVVLVLGGVMALAFIAGRTAYAPVFTGLEASDQAAVISYLEEEKIPYRTDSSANAILVPAGTEHRARIALAAKGIPSGGVVGFERFDNMKVGVTTFQEKNVAYYRALEGELSRTIREMSQVVSARVSVVVPEAKLFLKEQQPSTAAVLLKLKPGATFSTDQARAIVHLVASSVEGLQPENVTLVDADGKIPFDQILDDTLVFAGAGSPKLKYREIERDHEREFEKKIRDTLGVALGPGKVQAAVRVELDFDQENTREKIFMPLEGKSIGLPSSTQNVEESYTGPGGVRGGPVGTTPNIPGYPWNPGANQGNAEYERADTITNYENSTYESQRVKAQGGIRRITATVLIDGELPEEGLKRWEGAVATAIGMDMSRGDSVSVLSFPFDTSAADAYAARLAAERRNRMILGGISFLILLLAVVAAVVAWLRKRRQAAALQTAGADDQAPSLRELLENPDLMTAQGELSVLEEQLRSYAMNNPEELANLIKNWVVDDV